MHAHSQSNASYLEDEDAVVFATQEPPYLEKPISIYITVLRAPETERVVGVRFSDFRTIAKNLTFRGRLSCHKPIPLRTILICAIRMSNMPLKRKLSTIFELRHLMWGSVLPVEQMENLSPITPI